jgi:TonB-dependent receptor
MFRFRSTNRKLLCATTAIWVAGTWPAAAQTAGTNSPVEMNLGTVVANGQASGAGAAGAAPSATGSLKQAEQLKKLAPNVISVQPQSEIQKNPDVNLADAFARIPGVSLVSDSGEGQFIDIRGLDADLDGTLFDGVHLTANDQASPSGGERAPDLGVFPAGIVGGIEVVKSLTPDMDAEGLGGSANILPITLPDDGGPMANITLAAGAETLRPTGIFQGSIQLGDSFAIPGMRSFTNAKPFTVIFGYSYYGDRRGIDDVEESYDSNTITGDGNEADLHNLQLRYYQEHRVRQGVYGEVDFDPSPQTGIFFRALRSGFSNYINKNRLEFDGIDAPNTNGPDGEFGSDGDFTNVTATPQSIHTNEYYTVTTDVLEAGGHTVIADALNVDTRLSYTQGSSIEPYNYGAEFDGNPIDFNYNVNNTEYRSFSTPGVNTADPSLYSLSAGGLTNNPQYSFDQEWAAALNVSFANAFAGGVGDAKFGSEVRLRSEGDLQYNFTNPNPGPNEGMVVGSNPELAYYNRHYVLPPFPAYNELLPQVPLIGADPNPNDPADPTGLGYGNFQSNISSFQHNSENVYAVYGQETIEFGKLEILAGLRMEDTNGTYRAYAGTDTGTQSTVNGDEIFTYAENTNRQDYINLFPSAQFKYTFDPEFQMRATYSTGIARPGFQQISAATSTTVGGGTNGEDAVTIGNPNLKPTTGNSFDLTAEYYGPHATDFSGGIFYKTFNNYIFQTINDGTSLYQGVPTPSQITTFENTSGATAEGLELDAHQRFYMLPPPIDGLGIDGNITFVNSSGHSDGPTNKAYQLPETSPITYNATLFYETGPLYADVSVNYVSRSLYSTTNPAGSGLLDLNPRDADVFTAARTTLDANLEYNLTPRVVLFAQARNLTNAPLEFTQSASSQYPIQREFYNLDYLGGVRLKLGS